jgi:hypothetical protein
VAAVHRANCVVLTVRVTPLIVCDRATTPIETVAASSLLFPHDLPRWLHPVPAGRFFAAVTPAACRRAIIKTPEDWTSGSFDTPLQALAPSGPQAQAGVFLEPRIPTLVAGGPATRYRDPKPLPLRPAPTGLA